MAFRLSLFHFPKPRVFTYRPLYFDPEKEKWEQRRAHLRAQNGLPNSDVDQDLPVGEVARLFKRNYGAESGAPGSRIRGSFQRSLFEGRRRGGENKYIRIIVVLSILMLFVVAFYLSNGLSFLLKSLYAVPYP